MTATPAPASALTIAAAQAEMRQAYYGGAPGMLVSALAWGVAGLVALLHSPQRAVWVLFVGGMLIHPLGLVLTKALGRPARHVPANPFGTLALATTVWMLACLPLAYLASRLRIEWFFPAMLLVIGGRYLCFSTIYGDRIYWACGLALVAGGWLLAMANAAPYLGAFAGAALEAVFAAALFRTARREAEAVRAG